MSAFANTLMFSFCWGSICAEHANFTALKSRIILSRVLFGGAHYIQNCFVSSNCFFFIDKMYLVARVIALQQQRQQQRSICSVALPPLSQERSRSRNGKSGAHMSARASEDEKVVFDTCACASAEMNIYFLASFEMSAQARAGAQF